LSIDCGCKDSKAIDTDDYPILCNLIYSIIEILYRIYTKFENADLLNIAVFIGHLAYSLIYWGVRLDCSWWPYPLFK